MSKDKKEELARLLEQQSKARRDEVFGGLTHSERAAYEARRNRIHVLENEVLEARQIDSDAANQRREWNKQSEADTPQNDARQPYRSREQDSSKAFADSQKKSSTEKTDSDKSPDN
jgi:hypothetical protein